MVLAEGNPVKCPNIGGISGNSLKIQLVFPTRYPVSQGISTGLAS